MIFEAKHFNLQRSYFLWIRQIFQGRSYVTMAIILWSLGGQVCLSFLIELGTDAILMSHNKGKNSLFGAIPYDPIIKRIENGEINLVFSTHKKENTKLGIMNHLQILWILVSFLQLERSQNCFHMQWKGACGPSFDVDTFIAKKDSGVYWVFLDAESWRQYEVKAFWLDNPWKW